MNLGGTPAPRGWGAEQDGPENTTRPATAPSPPVNPALRSLRQRTESLEGIDPRPVAVAPRDTESVGAHQGGLHRADIRWYRGGVEQGPAAHFLHTGCAGARQPEPASRNVPFALAPLPFDPNPIVAPSDRVRRASPAPGTGGCIIHASADLFSSPVNAS